MNIVCNICYPGVLSVPQRCIARELWESYDMSSEHYGVAEMF